MDSDCLESKNPLSGRVPQALLIASYAACGSLLVFYLVNWIDSQIPDYYSKEYIGRFGLPATFFFSLPALISFLGILVSLYYGAKKQQVDERVETVTEKLLSEKQSQALGLVMISPFVVIASQIMGLLGYAWTTSHLVVIIYHFLVGGIVGISAGEYVYCSSIKHWSKERTEKEYEEHLKIFGDLFRSFSLLAVSGGITLVITTYTEIEFMPLVFGTQEYWPLATVVLFFYLAFGAFCVYLLGYYLSMGQIKKHFFETYDFTKPKRLE